MDFDFTNFITVETLKSFTGQVMVIVLVTQLVKELSRGHLSDSLKWVAVVVGVGTQFVVNVLDGPVLKGMLIAINGMIVAIVAMKGADMLKEKREEKPKEKPKNQPPIELNEKEVVK